MTSDQGPSLVRMCWAGADRTYSSTEGGFSYSTYLEEYYLFSIYAMFIPPEIAAAEHEIF